MSKIRFRYRKTGKAKYISHLDLMSTMQRAILRAGVKLKYSEGFNPHPYISAALPLSVGCESICELMDVEITGDELPGGFDHLLPEGLSISEAYLPIRKFSDIMWIEINCLLHYYTPSSEINTGMLIDHFNKTGLMIEKKSKGKTAYIDVSPFIRDVTFNCGEIIEMTATTSAQNPTINRNDIANVLRCGDKNLIPDDIELKRIEIYDKDMLLFR